MNFRYVAAAVWQVFTFFFNDKHQGKDVQRSPTVDVSVVKNLLPSLRTIVNDATDVFCMNRGEVVYTVAARSCSQFAGQSG